MTRIEFKGQVLTFDREHYRWECPTDSRLAQKISTSLDPLGPGGEDPHPPATAAIQAQAVFGVKILEVDPPPKMVAGRVY